MNPQTGSRAKDFFLNLGATISLYTVVISLVNLLFTVINTAYPQINNYYYGSSTISWPVAVLVIFTPILMVLMWNLGKSYTTEQPSTIHKWLTYITLFIAGLVVAGDLVSVLYHFINGDELSTAFLLKALTLFVVSGALFGYYLTDIRGKLTPQLRKMWRIASIVIIIGSIILGFAVLGSPRTQRLFKYDEAKINDLMSLGSSVQSYYSQKAVLPKNLTELSALNYYYVQNDPQSGKPYEYNVKSATTFEVCAEFNKDSAAKTDPRSLSYAPSYPYGTNWTHPAGRHCFEQSVVNNGVKLPM